MKQLSDLLTKFQDRVRNRGVPVRLPADSAKAERSKRVLGAGSPASADHRIVAKRTATPTPKLF